MKDQSQPPDQPLTSMDSFEEQTDLASVLQGILDDAVASGEECGCQLTVFRHGRLVAQLCAGFVDETRTKPVATDTLFPIFSVGKGMMTTAFHRLVEDGLISYDTRVAEVWPEFGGQGRDDIRVWQVLCHRTGMHIAPPTKDVAEMTDWDEMCRRLTTMAPAVPPGGKCCYQGLTYAWLLGETAGRVAGKHFQQVMREQVIAPLGLENEMMFGLPAAVEERCARVDGTAFAQRPQWAEAFLGSEAVRRGFIPSANGFATATALARHYAALLSSGMDGVQLLTPATLERATVLQRHEDDPIPPGGCWNKFGLGYVLAGPENDLGQTFGHGGAGGAEGLADRRTGLALGFTKNKLSPRHPDHPVRDRISRVLGLTLRHW